MRFFVSIILAFVLISNVSMAETWKEILPLENGQTLQGDLDSLKVSGDKSVINVVGSFRVNDEFNTAFRGKINLSPCWHHLNGKVELKTISSVGKEIDHSTQVYSWSKDGSHVYDIVGQVLCAFGQEQLRSQLNPIVPERNTRGGLVW